MVRCLRLFTQDRNRRTSSGLKTMDNFSDNGALYGHELVRDIAEGRKDAHDVTIFRDVQLAAFQAFLFVRYGDHECVWELDERDEVTPEELERISAEIILTAAEIELVLAAQEAELRN